MITATITRANYDAFTGVLSVTGENIDAFIKIDVSKLSLLGHDSAVYTLTSANVSPSSASSFVVQLNDDDRLAVNGLLNKNGTSAASGTTFNLAAAAEWDGVGSLADTVDNPVTVSNVLPPTITAASYNASTHVLTLTGANLVGTVGPTNDVTTSKLTVTGQGGASYTLATTGNVEILSATSVSITLAGADVAAVAALLNQNGAGSQGGTTYNIALADDWNSVVTGGNITVSTVPITVSAVAPTTTIGSFALSADTGSSNTDFITRTAAQTLSGTTSANLVSGEFVEVSTDNGSSWITATSTVGQSTWSASLTLSGSSTLKVRVSNADASSTAASQTYTLDIAAPSAPSTPDLASVLDTGASNSDNITNVTTPAFTGTAESGATVTLYDTDGTTVLGKTVANSGIWSITSSALSEGAHTLTAKATDVAGNVSDVSTGLSVTIDITAPTLAITSNVSSLKTGETATVTFTFSEDPGASFTWNGTTGDVVVTGGTLGAISGTGLTRTATFTPTAFTNAGSASITVAAGSYTDTAGNNGISGTTPSLTFDTLAPTLAITSNVSSLKAGETATITFTFSEDPGAGFSADNLTVSGGTLGVISGTGLTRSASFTPTAGVDSGTASIAVNPAANYTDAAGNAGTGGTTPALTFDTLAPILQSATVVSDALILTYSETSDLDVVNPPETSAFAVKAGGTSIAVTAVLVDAVAHTVTLTLASAVASGQVVTIDYDDPTGSDDLNAIQDIAGNDAASFSGFAVTNSTPAAPGGGDPVTPTAPSVALALGAISFGIMPEADAAQIQADIAGGAYTFEEFVDTLISSLQPTVLPALIVTDILGGQRPTEAHLAELVEFTALQLASYTAMGVTDPRLGPYEAMGLGYSETLAFQADWAGVADDVFSQQAYQLVFGRAASGVQEAHFNAQMAYFETIYLANGQSAADADIHAKGAVIGQMIGHAVIDEPELHSFDNTAVDFLKLAAVGQATYGEPLAMI